MNQWLSRNLHATAFLGAYFITTVAGNLIFVTPLVHQSLGSAGWSTEFLTFPNTFTFGYWALLLCPFVLTPLIVSVTRRLAGGRVAAAALALPEFRPWDYACVICACFGYVIYRFSAVDVWQTFASGADGASSIEVRFLIRERLGFFTLVLLQAILPYLAIYAFVAWMHSRRLFWLIFSLVDFFVLSALLVMMNMKWPVLLFYIGIVLTMVVFAKRHAYLKAAIGAVFVSLAVLVVSTFVFRMAPDVGNAGQRNAGTLSRASDRILATTKAAATYTPHILTIALNRMAIPYPYYYQVFTADGPVCGGILAQAHRNPTCRPSELIAARMFGSRAYGTDEFESGATAPIAVHISGYALGGWPVAMLALLAGSVILGLFSALPLDKGPAAGSLVILGALTGYHLSQIPGEGVIIYEHGLLWTLLLVGAYFLWRRVLFRPLANALSQAGSD